MEKKRAVIYARYSSAKQHEQTIETQLEVSHAFAEREGYVVVGEYVDRKRTGKFDTRPAFRQMIVDSEKGKFDYVIFYQLDRWARNRRDSINYEFELMVRGIKILSATEPINDDGEGAFWLKGIYELKNEAFSIKLKERVIDSQLTTLANGNFIGGVVTLGYRVENKKLLIDEQTAPTVREIFERASRGEFATSIFTDIKKRGLFPTIKDNQTINRMLKNIRYTGVTYYHGQRFDNVYPQIIDEELFAAVQKRLLRPAGTCKAHVNYYLSGKLFCGECYSPMRAERGNGKGGTYFYYKCANRAAHKCAAKAIRKEALESLVIHSIQDMLTVDLVNDIASFAIARRVDNIKKDPQLELLTAGRRAVQKKIDNITAAIEDGLYSDTINERLRLLENERTTFDSQIYAAKQYYKANVTDDDIKAELLNFANTAEPNEEYFKSFFNVFVQSVVVYKTKILVVFNVFEGNVIKFDIKKIQTLELESSYSNQMASLNFIKKNKLIFLNQFFGIFEIFFDKNP